MSRLPKQYCPCGQPLHYSLPHLEAFVSRQVEQNGATVIVRVGGRAWKVPRHYIALHGLKASELPALAKQYGFEEV